MWTETSDSSPEKRDLRASSIVPQARRPFAVKALRPLVHAGDTTAEARGHLFRLEALGAQQRDPGAFTVASRGRSGPHPPFQLLILLRMQLEDGDRPCHGTFVATQYDPVALFFQLI